MSDWAASFKKILDSRKFFQTLAITLLNMNGFSKFKKESGDSNTIKISILHLCACTGAENGYRNLIKKTFAQNRK